MYLTQAQLSREIDCISRIAVLCSGQKASAHDHQQFVCSSILRYALEADLTDTPFERCVYRRVLHSVKEVDMRIYASDLKYIKQKYLMYIQGSSQVGTWQQFKPVVAQGVTYKWLFVVLAKLFTNVRHVLQWLSFDERLLLTTDVDTSQQITEYVAYEQQLSRQSYDPKLTEQLARIVSGWLFDLPIGYAPLTPKFGPGAVSDWKGRSPSLVKAQRLIYDERVISLFSRFWDLDPDEITCGAAGIPLYCNRIIFRPKNALKKRIISAEPCWLSWLQQALKELVYPYVNRHPKMNTDFSNQNRSRELALKGSISGEYATIDFSNASDSITTQLVYQAFESTYLRDLLIASRSTHGELPDGQIILLKKFAPMGSATCFFTMDILLLSVCELATRRTLGRVGTAGDYFVYGDDCILRHEIVAEFMQICTELHMRANVDKTYAQVGTPHYYRESCGIEAYDGVDITPFRISRFAGPLIDSEAAITPEYVDRAISFMNRAIIDYGYESVRSATWQLVLYCQGKLGRHTHLSKLIWDRCLRIDYSDYRGNPEQFPVRIGQHDLNGPCCLVVPDGTATNYRTRWRYNRNLQRGEVLVTHLLKKVADHHIDGAMDYWSFAAARGVRSGEDSPVLSGANGYRDQKWSWDWLGW